MHDLFVIRKIFLLYNKITLTEIYNVNNNYMITLTVNIR